MAELTVQEIKLYDTAGATEGIIPTYAAAASGGDSFVNTERTFVQIKNGSGGAITVTVAPAETEFFKDGHGAIPVDTISLTVPATTGDKMLPMPHASYAAGGKTSMTYSGVTTLTVGVFKLGRI